MFVKRVSAFRIMAVMIGLLAAVSSAWAQLEKRQTEERAALVNGATIPREEFDREVFRIQGVILGTGRPLTCAQLTSINKEVVESLIRREILYQESRKAVMVDKKEVDREIDGLKKQFLSDAEYQNELNRKNLTEDRLRAHVERTLFVQKYVARQFLEKASVTDGDLVAYYESHLYLFKQPLQVRVSHILIQSDSKWEAARKQEARRKAEEILKDLKNPKKIKDFATLAREVSDGPTRTNGGDLGYVKTGQLEKKIESAVFSLKAGEISDVIETDYGFHLFKVTDKKPETVFAYEDVKEKIRESLREEKAKQEADLHARSLREKADVKILLPELTQTPDKQVSTSSGK
jgi:peptidyl-prolyl cis-trans isomerase C